MRVALEAVAFDKREDAFHLALVVDVLGEDVLIERIAGRAVDEEHAVFAELRGRSARNSQRFCLAGWLSSGASS